MAHIRRKFHDAPGERPALAGWFLRQLRRLHDIERVLREGGATPAVRLRIRGLQARGIMALVRAAALGLRRGSNTILPKSAPGQALDYTLGQWGAMARYLDDGRAEIDNKLVENCLRPAVPGRRNHLFIGGAQDTCFASLRELASDGGFFLPMPWYSYRGLEPRLQRAHAGHTQGTGGDAVTRVPQCRR